MTGGKAGILARVTGFLAWVGTPFRVMARALMVLVNLTPRQMQALCTLAMIGGIVALSWQNALYVAMVKSAIGSRVAFDHPFYEIVLDQARYNSWIIGGFALFMSLIAFGAEWLRVRYKDFEAGTGRGEGEQ